MKKCPQADGTVSSVSPKQLITHSEKTWLQAMGPLRCWVSGHITELKDLGPGGCRVCKPGDSSGHRSSVQGKAPPSLGCC